MLDASKAGKIIRDAISRIPDEVVAELRGVVVDERARVLDERNQPLQGLWAAGNVVASHIGPGTIAPGLTLGLALTWGYIAGKNVAI